MPPRPDDVILLFGGDGSEHRVSVASAKNVARHLAGARLSFWRRDGAVVAVPPEELLGFERPFETDFAPKAEPGAEWPSLPEALDAARPRDVFCLALHGGSGENGTIQARLEERRLAFTGSGSEASRIAFDKVRARNLVAGRDVRVAEAVVVDPGGSPEPVGRLYESHGKLVLKPVADGSSHGMRIVETERELSAALVALRGDDVPYLAEAFIRGRELTVGVVEKEDEEDEGEGGHGLVALPCSEVRLAPGRTFDFEGKYLGKGTEEITPADVPEETSRAVQHLARTAHEVVGCAGYSRTDAIVPEDGGEPVFLEINTLPGLTPASFIPQQLKAAGIGMPEFLDSQIRLARRRRDATR